VVLGSSSGAALAQNCLCVPSSAGLLATFFGMTATSNGGAGNPTVNVPVWRLWDTSTGGGGCEWSNIETSPGVYDFTTCDPFTDRANAAGNTFSFVLGRTPCSQITTPGNCAGLYATGGCQKPKDLNTTNIILPAFITAFVNHENTRYPGLHFYIEGPNEADLGNNWCPDSGSGNGTMADLVTYTTSVKTTAQGIDPTILVGCPSASTYNASGPHLYGPATGHTPTAGNGYLQQAGAAASCDFINVHPYSFCGTPVSCTSTATLQSALTALQSLLTGFGITKPIIDTEVSWGQNTANVTMADADREAWDATFAIKAWNAGHAGVWSYQWICPGGTLSACFGTRSGSGVGAGVATAISTTQTWMIGAKHVVNDCNQNADGNGTWRCRYTSSGGTVNYFIWNDAGNQTFSVAGLNVTTQFNLDGSSSAIVANSLTAGKLPIRVQ
jgi:hypothetical protein